MHCKSQFKWSLWNQLNKPVSTNNIKGNTTLHGECKFIQALFGALSFMINVCRMKKQKHFVHPCQDFLWEKGVPSVLRHDQPKNELSEEVMKIHCKLLINDALLQAGNQQQKPVEVHAIQWLKSNATTLMDRSNAPDKAWFDTVEHLALVNNFLTKEQLGWKTPTQKQHGHTPDVSPWLCCHF